MCVCVGVCGRMAAGSVTIVANIVTCIHMRFMTHDLVCDTHDS